MRSAFLILLATALGVSAGPTITKADAYGQCGGTGVIGQAQCPSGYRCDPVNPNYSQCVPVTYPPPEQQSKRDVNVEVASEESSAELNKRQTTETRVIGVQSLNARCYNRQKIQTLQTSFPDQWNMFIAALEDIQLQPESSWVSWFGIGGIHGAPYIAWQNQPPPAGSYNTRLGYCVHGGPVFATWHRPYMLLIEQELQKRAAAIAARFTGTRAAAYQAAADQLRFPYWDWSDPVTRSDIPAVVMQSTISVTKPSSSGAPVGSTIRNPLFQYNFQSAATLRQYFSGNYANWMYTTRNPVSSTDPTPRNANANTAMRNGFTTRRSSTYQMFSMTSFNSMASQLEGIHNAVHTAIGGTNPLGHMSVTNVASFDPIFWLHHCNVDRLTVMYQAIYPANQLQATTAVATYARIVPGIDGAQDTLNTNLYPFKMNSGAWWKSNEIKSAGTIWKYKYGYPEVPCESNGVVTAAELSSSVRGHVNRLYGPTSTTTTTKRDTIGNIEKRSPAASPKAYALPEPKRYPHQPGYTPKDQPNYRGDVLVRNDYVVRFFMDHSELAGSWVAHVLLTCTPKKTAPGDYRTSPDRIGSFSSFGAPYVRKQSMPFSGELPITEVLIEKGVKIDKVSKTEEYLAKCLHIVITSGDEVPTEIPTSNLKTYKVGVYVAEGRYPSGLQEGDIFPTWGRRKYLNKVFLNKPGGIKTDKEMDYPVMLDGRVEDLEGDKETY